MSAQRSFRRVPPVAFGMLAALAASAAAQPARRSVVPADSLPLMGSDADDRARINEVRGSGTTAGRAIRAFSSQYRIGAAGDSLAWDVLAPELFTVHNSELPFSQNDGALWAGRGLSLRVRGGVAASRGRWRAILLPEIATATNSAFVDVDVAIWHRPGKDATRYKEFASPWNQPPVSADLPVRFSKTPHNEVTLGQSALWYQAGAVDVGVATENLWWGPGVHDALVMSNHAGGVPHAFVRTARPIATALGDVEGRLILGRLAESDHFDFDPENDVRSLSAGVVTLRPRWLPSLTLGATRAVYAPVSGTAALAGHALDVFGAFDRPGARSLADTSFTGGRDQLTSLFARWVFPTVGWEVYSEYGRAERPANLRDFLTDPGHTRAYVTGAQHVRPVGGGMLRLQVEIAQTEQSASYRYRPTGSWYTSRASPQGYTHRGQVIGASIGPGSSHQWLAGDYLTSRWSAGGFVGRWRFNTDAMYAATSFPRGTGWCEFDTTLYPGVRGGYRDRAWGAIHVEAMFGTRLNAFHQNNSGCPAPATGRNLRDVRNRTVRVTFAPRLFR